jgi:hypothetical protein
MKRAFIYIAAAAACIAAGGEVTARTMHIGYGHGVYCALGTAATVGCDKAPADGAARLASAAVIVVCIPLFALAYGSLSNAHLRKHMALHHAATVKAVSEEMGAVRRHVTTEVGGLHRRLDDHAQLIRAAAGAQVRGEAGSNPAEAGLPAESAVVPSPAATSRKLRKPAQPK